MFDLGEVFFTVDHNQLDKELVSKTGVSIKPAEGKHFQFYVDFVKGEISIDEYFDSLRKAVNSPASIALLNKVYSEAYLKFSSIDYGMIDLAKKLKTKYKLVCITNTNLLHQQINKERGLFDIFEKVFSSTDYKRLKDSSWFKDILLELNMVGSECLFIDDLKENVEAAKSAGINVMVFKDRDSLIKDLTDYGIKI